MSFQISANVCEQTHVFFFFILKQFSAQYVEK